MYNLYYEIKDNKGNLEKGEAININKGMKTINGVKNRLCKILRNKDIPHFTWINDLKGKDVLSYIIYSYDEKDICNKSKYKVIERFENCKAFFE